MFVFLMCFLHQEEKVAVAKAKDFLESNTYSADDPYTTALSAYALALLRSPYAPLALRRLNHMAITQGTAPPHPLHLRPVRGTHCPNSLTLPGAHSTHIQIMAGA